MKYLTNLPTNEIWVETLLELGHLYDAVQRNDAGLSATSLISLSRALVSLGEEGPLSATATEDFDCIQEVLDDVITQETLGFRNVFDGIFDPELGDIGEIRQIPILSDKGSLADLLMRDVKKIMAMRDLLKARIETDRQISGLKAA
ncbi:hypothetical protein PVW53_12930 [Seohaeicola sp. SP36]|uniref:hypothetical protein n=1 Tax=unclassified Seohaeicola TaxID=2641111 RepID=UPI00237A0E67|nr:MULTISPECIES: hypothetical protein [unclassified Seohaeicola]MDD9708416.1 hypothetical protein [Seohaeicola sp. 4SK31]MDD9736430.1 hypothetical protein [Seohaeicola sp. SP36]